MRSAISITCFNSNAFKLYGGLILLDYPSSVVLPALFKIPILPSGLVMVKEYRFTFWELYGNLKDFYKFQSYNILPSYVLITMPSKSARDTVVLVLDISHCWLSKFTSSISFIDSSASKSYPSSIKQCLRLNPLSNIAFTAYF